MARANERVAGLLAEYAELLAMTGGDRFKIRSYEKAARGVGGYATDLATLDETDIRKIPNVGASIAGKVHQAVQTGTFPQLEELRGQIPAGVLTLMRIPNLGPAKALAVYRELGIADIDALLAAVENGDLRQLKGFGPRTEQVIRTGIELVRGGAGRVLMATALDLAESIVERLAPLADRCTYAGSLRRGRETVGDIDILAAAADSGPLMAAFVALPEADTVLVRGETKTSIRTALHPAAALPAAGTGAGKQPDADHAGAAGDSAGSTSAGGLQIDLRVVPQEVWGAALQYFTGSREHNVRVRELAVHAGLKLSEYGLFHAETDELIVAGTEQEVYERLGLRWVPPTLREDLGEVAAARNDELPELVTVDALRGDLHTHTNLTDGVATLDEMLTAAAERGYDYYAVTDHAPELFMQRMTLEKALAQRERLAELRGRYPGMRLLHGTELNIAPDGSVDWPEDVLAEFDLCVASVHSHFTLPAAEQTRRLIRACENPYVQIIGHPTGRLIGRREPIELDLPAVFEAAAATGTALEINGGPDRLDLRDEHIRWAAERGVTFAISSDAHAVPQLDFVRYATLTAQRGWLTPDQVLNCWPYERVLEFLTRPR
ncbi:helix-hairpin-helix domain-containing protein [Actinocatenispora comari]|uniref:DNA polymerase beta n=1 Tax=Actinocatenispora comari TaxID=2807577 RepID=A0A8J4ERB0_9ACTN|nr:helix-hairpin-helix domain-containing protein [Actinocatenispora comari]GIL30669.1 DNA polymerase/3'-5' exonuclease PolX [Actinocatenispora comari]